MTDTDDVFRGLNDPTRRAILSLLSGDARLSSGEIADNFPSIGRTAVSAHLRILRETNLVAEEKEGRNRFYTLGSNRATSAVDFLQRIYSSSVTADDVNQNPAPRRRGRPSRAQVEARFRSVREAG